MEENIFKTENNYQPLAEILRPKTQNDLLGVPKKAMQILERSIEPSFTPPSLILWGPPGCGKTSFAKVLSNLTKFNFYNFSSVSGGVKDVREVINNAKDFPIIFFIDEVHRFNRGQQDVFLPHIESGKIILIGATTENPSFYLTRALLSRCQVLLFSNLAKNDLLKLLTKIQSRVELEIAEDAKDFLIQAAAGDARQLINFCESLSNGGIKHITTSVLEDFFSSNPSVYYDRNQDQHYQHASAFIKSLRGSDADAALFYGFRMLEAGEDPRFLIRRMICFASEDIGNADPRALTLAVSTLQAYEHIGLPEGRIPIAQCITYLATAPKSNRSYEAMHKALKAIASNKLAVVPKHLINAPTALMKELEYGKDYQYPHDYDQAWLSNVKYLPEEVIGGFYKPSDRGYEKQISERLAWLKEKK